MNLRQRLIGAGEAVGACLVFCGVCSVYDGNAPWYVGAPYFLVHTGLSMDAVSRVFLGKAFYKLKNREVMCDDSAKRES